MAQTGDSKVAGWLADMHPAYFALVMATGIVSIAAKLLGIPIVPPVLFALNLVFYPTPFATAKRCWPIWPTMGAPSAFSRW
jgi:hypothetical protein